MKKYFYNIIGGISLGLGGAGVFLPLLPTTCFILLASWAFAKSSPKFHNWLNYRSPFAKSIQDWQQHQVIPTKVKCIARSSIAVSYSVTFLLVDNIFVLSSVGIGLLGLVAYLFSKPGEVQETTYQQLPLLHQQAN